MMKVFSLCDDSVFGSLDDHLEPFAESMGVQRGNRVDTFAFELTARAHPLFHRAFQIPRG